MDEYELPISTGFLNFTKIPIKIHIQQMLHQAFIPVHHQMLIALKEKLQTFCAPTYARSGVNQM
jgi:hypothetical protein